MVGEIVLSGPKANERIIVDGSQFVMKETWYKTIDKIIAVAKKESISIEIEDGEFEKGKSREFTIKYKHKDCLMVEKILFNSGVRRSEDGQYSIN